MKRSLVAEAAAREQPGSLSVAAAVPFGSARGRRQRRPNSLIFNTELIGRVAFGKRGNQLSWQRRSSIANEGKMKGQPQRAALERGMMRR